MPKPFAQSVSMNDRLETVIVKLMAKYEQILEATYQ